MYVMKRVTGNNKNYLLATLAKYFSYLCKLFDKCLSDRMLSIKMFIKIRGLIMHEVRHILTRKTTLRVILREMNLVQISKLISDINDIYEDMFNEMCSIELADQDKQKKIIQIKAMIVEAGIDMSELVDNTTKKRIPVKSKYRLVEDKTGRTFEWTGRGRKPLWMVEYELNGGQRDDLLIR